MTTAYDAIAHLNPCSDAARWLCTQPDVETAWNACERPDWMLWILGRNGTPKETIITLAVRFARSVLHLVPVAIEASERWRANPSEKKNRRAASRAAADAAARAAYTAGIAAYAAADAASRAAADVAARAADAARAAAAYAARKSQCDMIRELVPMIEVSK